MSSREVMEAHLRRIEAENPRVNAIVTLVADQALEAADATGSPAISVPAGFSTGGLPVGIQIVGRYRDDWSVLQLAHAFEGATGHWKRHPV